MSEKPTTVAEMARMGESPSRRLGSRVRTAIDYLGSDALSDSAAGGRGRKLGLAPCPAGRRARRDSPRPGLPPVQHLRAQEMVAGGAALTELSIVLSGCWRPFQLRRELRSATKS